MESYILYDCEVSPGMFRNERIVKFTLNQVDYQTIVHESMVAGNQIKLKIHSKNMRFIHLYIPGEIWDGARFQEIPADEINKYTVIYDLPRPKG